MSESIARVIYNRDLLTNIFEFLNKNDLKRLKISKDFRNLTHSEHIAPQHNTLLYGQVQSGKTSKLIEYIKTFKPDVLKILILQNNKCMLSQYSKALSFNNIQFKVIYSDSATKSFNNENVLITIHNKYRMDSLQKFINNNKIKKYCLVLDESDQYLHKIEKNEIFKKAKHVLHVTATPFKYLNKFSVDNVIKLKPNKNYVGLDNIDIEPVVLYNENVGFEGLKTKIRDIINTDFLNQSDGFMLINCFRFVIEMKNAGIALSVQYPDVPIIVLSTKSHIIKRGQITNCSFKNIQTFMDNFNNNSHIIVIANRMSTRGVNYTNSSYSRFITHQISMTIENKTNFLQKCRIFGNRNDQSNNKAKIYCMVCTNKQLNFIENLKSRINKSLNKIINKEELPKEKKITVKQLKQLCRDHKVRGFSKLRKEELIQLLNENNINYL